MTMYQIEFVSNWKYLRSRHSFMERTLKINSPEFESLLNIHYHIHLETWYKLLKFSKPQFSSVVKWSLVISVLRGRCKNWTNIYKVFVKKHISEKIPNKCQSLPLVNIEITKIFLQFYCVWIHLNVKGIVSVVLRFPSLWGRQAYLKRVGSIK